jgi:hypothetical protein
MASCTSTEVQSDTEEEVYEVVMLSLRPRVKYLFIEGFRMIIKV